MSIEYKNPRQYVQDAITAAIGVQSQLDDTRLRWNIEAYIATSVQELKTEEINNWVQLIIKDSDILRWHEAIAAGEDKFREFTIEVINSKVDVYKRLGLEIPYTSIGLGLMVPDILKMKFVIQCSNTLLHILDLLQKELAMRLNMESERVIAYINRQNIGTPQVSSSPQFITNLTETQLHNLCAGLIDNGFIAHDTDENSFIWALGGATRPDQFKPIHWTKPTSTNSQAINKVALFDLLNLLGLDFQSLRDLKRINEIFSFPSKMSTKNRSDAQNFGWISEYHAELGSIIVLL